jgi:cell division transport system ATP-binding protein
LITFDNVTKKYPNGHQALNNVCVNLNLGEMVFLQGHSGAGKSTFLKLIALMERPSRGEVKVGGKDLNAIKSYKIPFYRRQLGFISQNPQLLNDRTVFENVALPLQVTGFDRHDIARRVHAALERVGLTEKERVKPITLSEGEKQRVGIARAIVHKPQILLADEPTGNLDPKLAKDIMRLFVRFNQVGVTVLIASHDIHLLDQFPFRKLILNQGQLNEERR